MIRTILLTLVILHSLSIFSQDYKRTAAWYFGENAGINFNTSPPTALTDGKVNTIEGCASICDTNGNLLFYTDGETVWNKYHDTMPNGKGLLGHVSSTQRALIVPKPNDDSLYYVFTTSPDFHVSEVNPLKNNGVGELTMKNKLLVSSVGEKQTATKHANGKDYWVVTHGAFNDEYYSFLVTKDGIIDCPIISKIGNDFSLYSWFINQGSMKANIKGDKIATCLFNARMIELFHFNNSSGVLSDVKQINTINNYLYGIEFSPNGKMLYITERDNNLVQYEVSVFDNTVIQNSKKEIFKFIPNDIQKIQMGFDGRIYVANAGKLQIGVINEPNKIDTLCNFKLDGYNLAPKKSLFGLPDFVTSFFYRPAINFGYTQDCRTNTITFNGFDTINAKTYRWYFTKGLQKDSSTLKNPTYTFIDTGNYTITFIALNGSLIDTVSKNIYIYPKYTLNLGKDTTICNTPFTLKAGAGQFCYTWQDSSSNTTFEVNKTGTYHVKVITQNFCTQLDTIRVTITSPPTKPTVARNNDTLISSTAFKYQWYKDNNPINGAIQQKYKITQNGIYKVEAIDSNGCKSMSDTFNYKYLSINTYQSSNLFAIYPNSTKTNLYIEKPSHIDFYSIKILDVQGKVILITQLLTGNTEEIHLEGIAAGVYIVQITVNNTITETHKIIIQH